MVYLTTQQKFLIDKKHPADVFEDMSDFFGMYSANIDYFQDFSIKISLPQSFNLTNDPQIQQKYDDFIKVIMYADPSANILPISHHTDDDHNNSDIAILSLQYLDKKPNNTFYHRILTALMPQFEQQISASGWEQPYQHTKNSQTAQTHHAYTQQQHQNTSASNEEPLTKNPTSQQSTQTNKPYHQSKTTTSSINDTLKKYRDFLTQKIYQTVLNTSLTQQTIESITFLTKDGLSSAFVEHVFTTFETSSAHGAIDLITYIQTELYPLLQTLGVDFSESLRFLMKNVVNASPQQKQIISSGHFDLKEINIDINIGKEPIKNTSPNSSQQHKQPSTQSSIHPIPNSHDTAPQGLRLKAQISDAMGERTIVIKQFPALFASHHAEKHIKLISEHISDVTFQIVQTDIHLYLLTQHKNETLINGQPVNDKQRLMPNDEISIGKDIKIILTT